MNTPLVLEIEIEELEPKTAPQSEMGALELQ